jgi:Mg/Co/Ni transporter MgtE
MGFNPQSAGGLMNVDFVSCAATATAAEALALVAAARSIQPEALLKLHVVDEDERLVGVVSVIALLQAEPGESVGNLMDSDPVRVSANADLTDVALLMADYNLYAIPVVDEQDRVLGVVTVDDVLEATIPEDWRRREPAPRPVREPTQPGDDRNAAVPGGAAP